MTPEQLEKLNQLGKSVADMQGQLIDMQRNKPEVELLGCAITVSLEDLKATVKVLEHYKIQGFKSIQL